MLCLLWLLSALVYVSDARFFNNPVIDGGDYPDPGVILVDGIYYAVTTTNNWEWEKYPIHTSKDLQNWTLIGHIFNKTNFPVWSGLGYEFFAPEIHKVGDQYICYFTSRDNVTDVLTIGAAYSKNVAGPYTSLPRPLKIASSGAWVLDSTLMKAPGTLMLAWVESQFIRIANLTDDGLAFKDDTVVALFQPELPWEGGTVEGPWYLYRNGYHYMFYSGNGYCSEFYALGVARSRTAAGPYEKYPDALLVSNDRFKGPGHGSIVWDQVAGGNTTYAFVHHAWKAGQVCDPYVRYMFTTTMEWGEDDWPKKMAMT